MSCENCPVDLHDLRHIVSVDDRYVEESGVGVGVHQGSVVRPPLFIILVDALSRELRKGCPWALLYADGLMINAEFPEELLVKMKKRKTDTWQRRPAGEHGVDKDL